MDAATLPQHPWPPDPVRDDFDESALRLCWNFLRNPNDATWSLTDRPGWLRLRGSAYSLDDPASPAAVFRRQQHHEVEAATLIECTPRTPGEQAGLAVLMNNTHHYEIVIAREQGSRCVQLRRRIGDLSATTARVAIPDGPIVLGVRADTEHYSFYYGRPGDEPTPLGRGLVRHLSTEVAGGFTGVFFGLFASGGGVPCQGPADFDYFDYRPRQCS
jgi:alpha-N-arabinofuranosidase